MLFIIPFMEKISIEFEFIEILEFILIINSEKDATRSVSYLQDGMIKKIFA